jgi:hypothetical protein
MNILKSLGEFLATGAVLIVSYVLYFVIMAITTFVLGLPIALGIKVILDFMKIMFTQQP